MPRVVRKDLLCAWLFFVLLLGIPLGLLVTDHFERRAILESGQRVEGVIAARPVGESRMGSPVCGTLIAFKA